MLVDLHATVERFLAGESQPGSLLRTAVFDFSVPDADFRGALTSATINLFLFEIRENMDMRSSRPAPALVDCGYCITAWSPLERMHHPVLQEHRLLSQVLAVLLQHPQIPQRYWSGAIASQRSPYPTVVAHPDALKNQAEFWSALGHYPKPALTYIVTVAMPSVAELVAATPVGPDERAIRISVDQPAESPRS
jgi:Pvc16 N-terminal domain